MTEQKSSIQQTQSESLIDQEGSSISLEATKVYSKHSSRDKAQPKQAATKQHVLIGAKSSAANTQPIPLQLPMRSKSVTNMTESRLLSSSSSQQAPERIESTQLKSRHLQSLENVEMKGLQSELSSSSAAVFAGGSSAAAAVAVAGGLCALLNWMEVIEFVSWIVVYANKQKKVLTRRIAEILCEQWMSTALMKAATITVKSSTSTVYSNNRRRPSSQQSHITTNNMRDMRDMRESRIKSFVRTNAAVEAKHYDDEFVH